MSFWDKFLCPRAGAQSFREELRGTVHVSCFLRYKNRSPKSGLAREKQMVRAMTASETSGETGCVLCRVVRQQGGALTRKTTLCQRSPEGPATVPSEVR